jgi:hypothetical protein
LLYEYQEARLIANRPSFVPRLLVLQLGTIFLLLSCASTQPSPQIKVRVSPGFAGTIHLAACVPSAPATDISTDAQGNGSTSVCPGAGRSVAIVVVRADGEYTVALKDVSISRAGDGIATTINAQVRP